MVLGPTPEMVVQEYTAVSLLGRLVCLCVCNHVHWSVCFCAYVCVCTCVFCVWPWAAVDGLQQLGVPRFIALLHLANLNTHTNTHKQSNKHFIDAVLFPCKTTFFYAELFWLPCLFLFLTADWTTCSTCLLVAWVPTLSLWLRQWWGDKNSIHRNEGRGYTLCKSKTDVWIKGKINKRVLITENYCIWLAITTQFICTYSKWESGLKKKYIYI